MPQMRSTHLAVPDCMTYKLIFWDSGIKPIKLRVKDLDGPDPSS